MQGYAINLFSNPIFATGADPWVIYRDGFYYYCGSDGDRTIFIIKSATLTDFDEGSRTNVFIAPSSGPSAKFNVWGPHLNYIQGKWYIYYCAQPIDDPNFENMSMYVLEGSSDNPQGSYIDRGKLNLYAPGSDNWAIDGSVLERSDGTLYMTWSGITNFTTLQQNTYIARMDSPTAITSGTAVLISTPSQTWETQSRAIQEGQRPIYVDKNGKTVIAYSASASWTDEYCLGTLTNTDGNFLNPSSWVKSNGAVFKSSTEVFGPGGASYVKSPDGTEDWIVYHAKKYSGSGWDRAIHAQKFTWNIDGSPDFGTPLKAGTLHASPSGESESIKMGWGNSANGAKTSGTWSYFSDTEASCKSTGSVWPNWAKTFRGDIRLRDYTYEVDLKLIQKGISAAYPKYGIYACYKDENNYVVAALDQTTSQLVTYAIVGGVGQDWQGTSLTMNYYAYHNMKVTKLGSSFDFYIDGVLMQNRILDITNGQTGLVTEDAKADYKNASVSNYGWFESISGTAVTGTWTYYNNNSASLSSLGNTWPDWAKTFIGNSYLYDYSASANIKLVAKGTTADYPKYGIYACYKDANNYVGAFLESTTRQFVTYAVVDGVSQDWMGTALNITYTNYHNVKVEKAGSTFKFYVDGSLKQTRIFNIAYGQIGLVAEDAKADFKNVRFDSNIISGIAQNSTVESLFQNIFINTDTQLQIKNSDGVLLSEQSIVGSGATVDVLINGTSDKKFTLIIYGDTNSDGSVNITDLTAIKGHILKLSSLEGVDFIAADMFKKGRITVNDLLQVKKVLLGLT